jgi:hypothetical protein
MERKMHDDGVKTAGHVGNSRPIMSICISSRVNYQEYGVCRHMRG